MRHSRAQKLFSAAVDGELSSRLHQRLDEHLEECPECRREFELLALTHRLLGLEEGELSTDFTDRLIDRLREERTERKVVEMGRVSHNLRLAVGAVSLLLLFLWGDRMHILPELRGETWHSYEKQVVSWMP